MPKEINAVSIAKDVIKLVKAEKFVAAEGFYFEPIHGRLVDGGLQQQIKGRKAQMCKVCAIGGLFFAHVYRNNSYNIQGRSCGPYSAEMRVHLVPYISLKQLYLIEASFERSAGMAGADTLAMAAELFGRRYEYSDDRMVAIMQNIIDNGGVFKPEVSA